MSRAWVGALALLVCGAVSGFAQSASATPAVQASSSLTRHPVVLVHGAFGFDSLGPVDYFNGVARALRGLGAEVLVTQTSAIHRTAYRAQQLKEQIEQAYPDPATKLNLIAHSQGGLDARYMINHLGMRGRVASLSTLSTPHRGTAIADVTVATTPRRIRDLSELLLSRFGWDGRLLEDLTVRRMALFNLLTPDDPRILYQSWGGRATVWGRGGSGRLTVLFYPSYTVVNRLEGPNDGLVSLRSARWGVWRGELPSDHGGLIGWGFSRFDHVSQYEDMVLELARLGF